MSIIHKVFSDSIFTASRYILLFARRILIISLITKILGADTYGSWVTIVAVVGLLSAAAETHLHGSMIRYTPQETNVNQTYSDILFISVIFGAITTVIIFFFGMMIDLSKYIDIQVANQSSLVLVTSLLVFSEVIFYININYPRARGNVKIYDVVFAARSVIEGVLLIIVFSSGGSILEGLSVILAVTVVFNLITPAVIAKKWSIPWPNPANFQKHLRYAIPMLPQQMSSRLIKHTDKFLLLFILGPKMVGIYAVADAVSKPISQFASVLNPTLYPTVAGAWEEQKYSEIIQMYAVTFRYFFILGIPGVVGLVLLSDSLMTLMSTAEITAEGRYVVPVLILAYFFWGLDSNLRFVLTSAEKTHLIGSLLAISILINIVLNVLLIPRIGIMGAAASTLSSHLFLFLTVFYFSITTIPITVRKTDLIPCKTISRSLFAAAVMGGILYFIDPQLSTVASVVLLPLLGASLYFVVLFISGEFSQSEVDRLVKYVN